MHTHARLAFLFLAVFLLIGVAACDTGDDDCDCPDAGDGDDDEEFEDPQIEITEPTPLLNPDGSLAARGWARRPLMIYNPENVQEAMQGRIKEWDAYLIIGPEFMLGVTISDIRLATFVSFEMIDFRTTEIRTGIDLQIGSLGFMPRDMYGTIDFRRGGNWFQLEYVDGVRTLTGHFDESLMSPQWDCQLVLTQDPLEEDVAAAAPFLQEGEFFYENKIVGMVASGEFTLEGQTYVFDSAESFAVLDWGRGILPHINAWHWGVAAGYVDGRIVGFNIGNGWNDDSLGTSNAQKIDGAIHKLYHVYFDYNPNKEMEPWVITSDGDRLNAVLTPFYYQKTGMMILDLGMLVDKVYGHVSGTMTQDDGTVVEFQDLVGFIEWSSQRW